jgi:hypothetical protein
VLLLANTGVVQAPSKAYFAPLGIGTILVIVRVAWRGIPRDQTGSMATRFIALIVVLLIGLAYAAVSTARREGNELVVTSPDEGEPPPTGGTPTGSPPGEPKIPLAPWPRLPPIRGATEELPDATIDDCRSNNVNRTVASAAALGAGALTIALCRDEVVYYRMVVPAGTYRAWLGATGPSPFQVTAFTTKEPKLEDFTKAGYDVTQEMRSKRLEEDLFFQGAAGATGTYPIGLQDGMLIRVLSRQRNAVSLRVSFDAAPERPELFAPSVNGNSVTLRWRGVPGETKYLVSWRVDQRVVSPINSERRNVDGTETTIEMTQSGEYEFVVSGNSVSLPSDPVRVRH